MAKRAIRLEQLTYYDVADHGHIDSCLINELNKHRAILNALSKKAKLTEDDVETFEQE